VVRITWLRPEERLEHEFKQLREQGLDPSALEEAWRRAAPEEKPALAPSLLDRAGELSRQRAEMDVEAFLLELPLGTPPRTWSRDFLYDRLLGGWTGRAAGCLLGKPVEKVPRAGIRALLESIGEWPLRQYFTAVGVPPEVTSAYPWNRASLPTSMRENIECMPEDDDTNYTMLGLHILETRGPDFTTDDVATVWLQTMPVLTVFTAERVAYYNLLSYIEPPETARYRNPYREWIGAQIRADMWGYVSPGDPVRAAHYAWRDARLSHTENGIYGEMFMAATIAAAFTCESPEAALRQGLAVVPPESRLAEAIGFSLELPRKTADWEGALDLLYARYGHLHWVHTVNNAALVAAALLYGDGDFERTVTLAVMGGWDTDCNGATAGSVIGCMFGADAIPRSWSEPLANRVRSSLKGFDNAALTDLASRTLAVVPDTYLETSVPQ